MLNGGLLVSVKKEKGVGGKSREGPLRSSRVAADGGHSAGQGGGWEGWFSSLLNPPTHGPAHPHSPSHLFLLRPNVVRRQFHSPVLCWEPGSSREGPSRLPLWGQANNQELGAWGQAGHWFRQ